MDKLFPTPQERDNENLVQLLCELHARSLMYGTKVLDEAHKEAKKEVLLRMENYIFAEDANRFAEDTNRLDFSILADTSEEEEVVWPSNGEEFDILVLAMPDLDFDVEEVVIHDAPCKVSSVLSEFGSHNITEALFTGDLPDSVGMWRMKIKFFATSCYDSWSGVYEDDWGFDVISSVKI